MFLLLFTSRSMGDSYGIKDGSNLSIHGSFANSQTRVPPAYLACNTLISSQRPPMLRGSRPPSRNHMSTIRCAQTRCQLRITVPPRRADLGTRGCHRVSEDDGQQGSSHGHDRGIFTVRNLTGAPDLNFPRYAMSLPHTALLALAESLGDKWPRSRL